MKEPTISVVMPIYNGEMYLKEAIDSILNQSFINFELLIINDASKDSSEEIILSYDDTRIRYIKNPVNLGLIGSLNVGLDNSQGKYIARMDQDDISHVDRLQLQYNFMESNPDYILLGTQANIINSKDTLQYPTTDKAIRVKLLFTTSFVHPTVIIRKSMLDANNLRYHEQYKHAEDYGFWIDLAAHGKMANLPQTGLYYRKHETQYTVVFNQAMFEMVSEIQKKYFEKNNVKMSNEDLNLFHIITKRRIDFSDKVKVKKIGLFLSRFSNYFDNARINKNEVKKISFNLWKRICDDRQKAGFFVYKTYISNPLAFNPFNLKLHLHYLKNDIFKIKHAK